jgi:hypothetical protein
MNKSAKSIATPCLGHFANLHANDIADCHVNSLPNLHPNSIANLRIPIDVNEIVDAWRNLLDNLHPGRRTLHSRFSDNIPARLWAKLPSMIGAFAEAESDAHDCDSLENAN